MTGSSYGLRRLVLVAVLGGAFAVPAPALAQSSSDEGYGGVGGNVQTNIEPGGDSVSSVDKVGTPASTPVSAKAANPVVDSLPFTGADLLNLLIGGLVLVGLGLGLRLLVVKDRHSDLTAR
jgi:hypothetical protein